MPALLLLIATLFQVADTSRVVIYPADTELRVGDRQRLTIVEAVYNVGERRLSEATVRWRSTNDAVVEVADDGTARAVSPGEARIAAVVDGQVGFARILVRQLPPARLVVSGPASLLDGSGADLRVTAATSAGAEVEPGPLTFRSDRTSVVSVDGTGRMTGHRVGEATITVQVGSVRTEWEVAVVPNAAASYDIFGPEALRTGDVGRFRVRGLTMSGADVDGFYPAWSVDSRGASMEADGQEGVFVAEAAGTFVVTAVVGPGVVLRRTVRVSPRLYDAELVLVGRGPVDTHHTGDMWVFEGVDGRDYAYTGTYLHDRMKVWDVTNPARPVLTDSVQVDARRINDVKIHPNGRIGVITREGASSRRNGIVLLDLSDPAHPTILSEYTDTVTGGVHNVWIVGDLDLVYACHNGTSDLHIIDISDPRKPTEVGRWGLENDDRSLHDVIVQDGYAYVSYWDDGLVVLDVGAGTHGGTPTRPVMVSRTAYPIGNTHVAWRQGRYVFVGDEFWVGGYVPDEPVQARGFIHVFDMTNPEAPKEVAWYEVPEAGAHNIWVEGDRLYIGHYQGGLRVVDISGELRGDLYRQGREVAVLKTTDRRTMIPNWPFTWGAQLHKGLIFSSDMNSGLWITRLTEGRPMP